MYSTSSCSWERASAGISILDGKKKAKLLTAANRFFVYTKQHFTQNGVREREKKPEWLAWQADVGDLGMMNVDGVNR